MNEQENKPTAAVVMLLFIFLGCGPCSGGEEEDLTPEGPETIYAPATMPFDVDPDVERMRQLYRMPVPNDFSRREDEPGLLIGVSASREYGAVAFPAADRAGYDIATVSVEKGWEREPLNDLEVERVGAVASAQSRDDDVVFAFRDRKPPHAISLWSWSPDDGPTQLDFDRVEPANFAEHTESCPDIDLAIADDGTIDLVYRQSSQELRYARRAPGSSTWEDVSIIQDARWLDTVPAGFDVGCSVRIEHDEGGVPNVLAWTRDRATDGVGESVAESELNGRNVGWFRTTTGEWRPTQWRYDAGVDPRVFGAQGLDMVTVGRDHLLIGDTFFTAHDEGGAPPNVVSTTARPWLIPDGQGAGEDDDLFPFPDPKRCIDSFHLAGEPSYGFALMRTGVSAITSFHPSQWRIHRLRGCKPHTGMRVPARPAPVMMTESTTGQRSPIAANGTRPYDLVMCLSEDGKLVVCGGGAQLGVPSDLPLFSITDGWPDTWIVSPGVQGFPLTIVQDRGEPARPEITVSRVDVGAGDSSRAADETIVSPPREGEPWLVTFNVLEGATYRISVDPGGIPSQSQRVDGFGEVFVFGEVGRFDPREPRHHPCVDEDELDERGVCTAPRQDLYIGETVDLPLVVDADSGWARPELYDAEGNIVPTEVVVEDIWQVSRWTGLVPQVELEQLSQYEVRYPEGTTNMFGAPFLVDQRVFPVSTRQGPLTVVETDPVYDQADVPLDTIIRVTFSGPVAFYNDGNDIFLDEEIDMNIRRVPITFRERPGNVFEITPESLLPSATYTLTLTDQLRAREDGNGRPLVDAPVYLRFTTVAQ